MKYDTHKKSMLKSIIWRILGVIVLATVVFFYTREWITTGLITIIHHATFLLVFYLHERVWLKGKIKCRNILKAITYEIVLGMGLGGLIVLMVTGQWSSVTKITITYTIIKLIMYVIYEKMWRPKKTIYAYVVADLFHKGHLKFLQEAKKQGGRLIVGVLTDKATMQKKPTPTIHYNERADIIEALRCVDEVIPQRDYSPIDNVIKIKPDILIESESHKKMPANDFVKSYRGKVVIFPYYIGQSSTEIKNKIIEKWKKTK